METEAITQIVAIDGPAGAGKSSAARAVAKQLGLQFLDTGAMYRAATWYALHNGVNLDDPEALAANTGAMHLEMPETGGVTRVLTGGHDITEVIRSPEVTRLIYKLDEVPAVRRHLVALQRIIGAQRPTVAEGRDIGTVVFPGAACKVYLDASLDARTQRRAKDLEAAGHVVDVEALREEIDGRDRRAMERADSPLRPADDAIHLDTSDMTLEEVTGVIVGMARERLAGGRP
jgi:cytidylate kinase